MKKTLLIVATLGLMLSSAKASVVINETNFPTVTRSQDYDGRITFASSNENVVKADGQSVVTGVSPMSRATWSM